MKITGGKLKNSLISIPDQKWVRPTSAKVREALFSMIGQDLSGLSFLDAYGGSGIMAIEAYSRGAFPVTICEKNNRVQSFIQRNLTSLQVDIRLHKKQVETLFGNGHFDIVFLDPPYAENINHLLHHFFSLSNQYLILETDRNHSVETIPSDWELWKMKFYGGTRLSIFTVK